MEPTERPKLPISQLNWGNRCNSEHLSKTVLSIYRGLAAGYTTEENGSLRDVILTDVKRTDGEKDSSAKVRWSRVPGKFFVISYSKIRNMNITYEQHSKKILQQIESLPSKIPGA